MNTVLAALLSVAVAWTAHAAEPTDPYDAFRSALDRVRNGEPTSARLPKVEPFPSVNQTVDASTAAACETHLLPMVIDGDTTTAAGRIRHAIQKLGVGHTLLIDDPDLRSGFESQWWTLLQNFGLRVLGMRPIAGFSRTQVLVQKAEAAEGVETRVANSVPLDQPGKFKLRYFKNQRTRGVFEMLELPAGVFSFPYYLEDGRVKLLLRPEAPGIPILEPLQEVHGTNYLPQPIHIGLQEGEAGGRKAVSLLKAVLPANLLARSRRRENLYFASPDTLLSPIQSVFVQLKGRPQQRVFDWSAWDAASLLPRLEETSGSDGVLELNVHLLLDAAGSARPSWIGERVTLENFDQPPAVFPRTLEFPRARNWARKRWWLPSESGKWKFVSSDIQELNQHGAQTALFHAEYAVSREGSSNLVSLLPVKKVNGRVWIGLLQSDSPAAQEHGETSVLWTVPTWRVYTGEQKLAQAVDDVKKLFVTRFETPVKSVQPLGASYRTDPEASSDLIYPFVAEVSGEERRIQWVPLEFARAHVGELRDARLMLSILRLAQAMEN